jgi:tetratricopeptide (TPR) repeat protein
MALNETLNTTGDPITRAMRSVMGQQPALNETPEQGMQRRISRGITAEEQLPSLMEAQRAESQKAQEDIAAQRTGAAKRREEIGKEFATQERMLVESPEYRQREMPAFEPSPTNLEDIRNVLALTTVAGFLVGGASKRSGLAAMAALNGGLEGFRQGRQEVYKRELDVFNKNIESIKENNRQTLDRFNKAMSLLQTDRKAAEGELKVLEAELENSTASAALRQGQYKQAQEILYKAVEGSDRASQTLLQMKQQAELARERMQMQRELAQDRMAFQREIAQLKQEGKIQSLPGPLDKRLENLGTSKDGINRISSSAKPEFFGLFPQKEVAETFLTLVDRGLPVGQVASQMAQTFGIKAPPITNDTVNFWKDYREFVAKVRNTLFGQTLTKAEERSFDQFTINPTTSAENARIYFDRQIQILNDAANRQRRIGRSIGVNDQTLNAYLGEEMPSQAQPQPQPQPQAIPAAAIDYLKRNPNAKADFDAKYGAGAADRYLSGAR